MLDRSSSLDKIAGQPLDDAITTGTQVTSTSFHDALFTQETRTIRAFTSRRGWRCLDSARQSVVLRLSSFSHAPTFGVHPSIPLTRLLLPGSRPISLCLTKQNHARWSRASRPDPLTEKADVSLVILVQSCPFHAGTFACTRP